VSAFVEEDGRSFHFARQQWKSCYEHGRRSRRSCNCDR
jgi:hypothetical protein